jgi:energy-coupling factor transport system ATP-binding protein
VIIEHRLADLARLASRMILMDKGRIIADGLPDLILNNSPLRDKLGLRRMTNEPQVAWEALIQGDGKNPTGKQPLLTLQNVSAGYNHIKVIEDINIALYPGDFVALVGNNGTGKSTLGLVAAGLLKPLSGRVRYLDRIKPRPGLDVAMLFQNPTDQLFTDSVDEEVAFGPCNYDRFDPEQHDEILQEADLLDLKERRFLMLSVGQQQRTTLAACLGLRPRLLILDEPTLGQDWGHLQRLMDFLMHLNRQGTAILLISHDYKLVHRYARSVFLMKNGRIQRTGRFEQSLFSNSRSITDLKEGVTYETVNS